MVNKLRDGDFKLRKKNINHLKLKKQKPIFFFLERTISGGNPATHDIIGIQLMFSDSDTDL